MSRVMIRDNVRDRFMARSSVRFRFRVVVRYRAKLLLGTVSGLGFCVKV